MPASKGSQALHAHRCGFAELTTEARTTKSWALASASQVAFIQNASTRPACSKKSARRHFKELKTFTRAACIDWVPPFHMSCSSMPSSSAAPAKSSHPPISCSPLAKVSPMSSFNNLQGGRTFKNRIFKKRSMGLGQGRILGPKFEKQLTKN